MSPKRFLDGDHKQHTKSGVVINGPRPTPLKIKQESHIIHKHQQQQPQIRKPIIIYTRSPKVIHTKPHEFMALVQKLTGKSCSKHHHQQQQQQQQQTKNKTLVDGYGLKENEICNDFGIDNGRNNVVKSKSLVFNTPLNIFASDIPLFTPNNSDYLFSPHGFLKLSDAVSSTSPNKTTNSFSPGSLVEFMKRLPEY
ncbi:VQ motif-containing protein 8, chloroplastic-like [Bidens hawaiensis]|uniref:VQ motif-containing protein 8, chloroplastic-like n=1 Tax=Bidens hawaiensis TaxID=980011 RepID=UPI00404B8E2F